MARRIQDPPSRVFSSPPIDAGDFFFVLFSFMVVLVSTWTCIYINEHEACLHAAGFVSNCPRERRGVREVLLCVSHFSVRSTAVHFCVFCHQVMDVMVWHYCMCRAVRIQAKHSLTKTKCNSIYLHMLLLFYIACMIMIA